MKLSAAGPSGTRYLVLPINVRMVQKQYLHYLAVVIMSNQMKRGEQATTAHVSAS